MLVGVNKVSNLYLNAKKEPKWDRVVQHPYVMALTVIFPDRDEFSPGFCVARIHIPVFKKSPDKKIRSVKKI